MGLRHKFTRTPGGRLKAAFLSLSQRETAEMFRVAPETIARWEMEAASADGEAHGQERPARDRRLGVKPRFGAIGKKGSIALIERLWRTLKDTLEPRLLRPLAAEDLAEKVRLGLVHYAHFRPHQGLGGATQAEIARLSNRQ